MTPIEILDEALADYLAAIKVDLPLVPLFIDGVPSPSVFGCEECATLHVPMWDDTTLYADRYVPMSGDRRGCEGCESLPVEYELETP